MALDLSNQTLATPNHIQHREALREAVATILGQAKRKICLFSPRLDSYLFNTSKVQEALSRLAARHHRNQILMIIEDSRQMTYHNERFVEICRRFSSSIQVRHVGEEHRGNQEMFIIIDHDCVLNQPTVSEPEAILDCESNTRISEFQRKFEAMWGRSESFSLTTPGL
ncbi:MAG: hypothetical protein BMS9Abin33_0267 [Gammaproteobacteria bacterium]|nr:MAG: hypothetical protein BMS9Abin33_0267 [Gammaproteobacteria bacterium]